MQLQRLRGDASVRAGAYPVDMDKAVACSLDDGDARTRLDAWRAALGHGVTAVEWPAPNEVHMRLADVPFADLAELARLEAACCPFFEFRIEITAAGSALIVSVPVDAEGVLRDFASLAGR